MAEFQPYKALCYQVFCEFAKHPQIHSYLRETCRYVAVCLMSVGSSPTACLLWEFVYNYFESNDFMTFRPFENDFLEMLADSDCAWGDQREVYLWFRLVDNNSRVRVPSFLLESDQEGEQVEFLRRHMQKEGLWDN